MPLDRFSEDIESRYATFAEAREGRNRGWIPDVVVPEDAVNIWEFHNIDTNATWGCFTLSSGADPLRLRLQKIGAKRTQGGLGAGPTRFLRTREWWPQASETDAAETCQYQESERFNITVGVLPGGSAARFRRSNR